LNIFFNQVFIPLREIIEVTSGKINTFHPHVICFEVTKEIDFLKSSPQTAGIGFQGLILFAITITKNKKTLPGRRIRVKN
jgi:hypothetical protein